MISIKNLCFSYDKIPVISNLYYDFNELGIYSVIGPNGAGKSTLLKSLAGIIKPTSGNVICHGKNIQEMDRKDIAKAVAFIPQNFYTNFEYTVEEIIKMGRFPYVGLLQNYSQNDKKIVNDIMKKLDLLEFKDSLITKLSGGEMQRAFIGRALAQNSDIILLDESFANLDIHHQIEIASLLKELQQVENKMIIMVTHNLNLASEFSHKIIFLKEGKIIEEGKPENVLTKSLLTEVYNENIEITKNPISKKPLIFFASN